MKRTGAHGSSASASARPCSSSPWHSSPRPAAVSSSSSSKPTGRRQVDHGQLGHRAAVARPGPRDRHDVGEHPPQHHGSARQARRRPQPVPSLAESWDDRARTARPSRSTCARTASGRTATRSPRRTSSGRGSGRSRRSSRADYAYQFYGIIGAQEYNGCKSRRLRRARATRSASRRSTTTRSRSQLTSPQPWFIQQVAHHSFLAVNRKAVEQFGDKWTEAANIVTNGPFKLEAWEHDSPIDLVKWDEWRDADERRARPRQRPDDHRRHDRRAGVRGRRDRRQPRPADRGDRRGSRRPTEYQQYPGARHLLLRLQRRRTSPT